MPEFNPHSSDATFARIIERLDAQDREALRREIETKERDAKILEQTTKTNGRVTVLETWRTEVTTRGAVLGGLAGGVVAVLGMLFQHWLRKS